MTPENFCYWLQGFIEMNTSPKDARTGYPSAEQWKMIKEHLGYVFNKPAQYVPTPIKIPDAVPLPYIPPPILPNDYLQPPFPGSPPLTIC